MKNPTVPRTPRKVLAIVLSVVFFVGGIAIGRWTGSDSGAREDFIGKQQALVRELNAEKRALRKARRDLASARRALDSLLQQVRKTEEAEEMEEDSVTAGLPPTEQTETLAGFQFTEQGFRKALNLRRDDLQSDVPLAEFLSRLSPAETIRAMDELRGGPQDPYRRQLSERFLKAWAKKDPAAVLAYTASGTACFSWQFDPG